MEDEETMSSWLSTVLLVYSLDVECCFSSKKKKKKKEWVCVCKEYKRIIFYFVILEKYCFSLNIRIEKKKWKIVIRNFSALVN